MVGDVAAGEVDAADGAGDGEALVHGHGVGDAVARVEDRAGGAARGVQREDGLDGQVQRRDVEGLEEDLRRREAVLLGVEGGLGQEDGVLRGCVVSVQLGPGECAGRRMARGLASSLSTRSPSRYTHSQMRSMSSQSVTTPCSSG